jgi:hypothetical protein
MEKMFVGPDNVVFMQQRQDQLIAVSPNSNLLTGEQWLYFLGE